MINHIKILTFLARKLKEKKNLMEKRESLKMELPWEDGNEEEEDFHYDCDLFLIVFWLVEVYPPMFEDKNIV
jgi:hypothetical protein